MTARRYFKRGWQWPWLVTAALLFTVGVNVVMLVAVSGDRNGSVVEPEYYRKAVAWDEAMARQAASDLLGWRATATLAPAAADSGRAIVPTAAGDASSALVVRVSDADGMPVTGARFVAVLIHNSDAARPLRTTLTETSAGRYEAPVRLAHAGMWEVRLEARREAERFVSTQRAEAAPARAAPPAGSR